MFSIEQSFPHTALSATCWLRYYTNKWILNPRKMESDLTMDQNQKLIWIDLREQHLITTVSKGKGLHLLLGREEVLRTFAVGF